MLVRYSLATLLKLTASACILVWLCTLPIGRFLIVAAVSLFAFAIAAMIIAFVFATGLVSLLYPLAWISCFIAGTPGERQLQKHLHQAEKSSSDSGSTSVD